MKWISALSRDASLDSGLARASDAMRAGLGTEKPDLLIVFVSEHHAPSYERVPDLLARHLTPGLLLGCSAGGVIGGGREIEQAPGIAMMGARLPDVDLTPILLGAGSLPPRGAPASAWEETVHVAAETGPHFLLLPDPLTFDAEAVLRGLDAAFPGATKIGGLASGGAPGSGNALFLGHNVHRRGLVGVALSGDVVVDAIVAQGCRPIGDPMFVTASDGNMICELDGRRPMDVLQGVYDRSDDTDKALFRHSLFLGIVMREAKEEYRHGDFLIRNILGGDPETGRLAVGASMRDGAVVQWHLRDAETSAQDLGEMLSAYASQPRPTAPAGALLFSCLGRGQGLYGKPDHDTEAFRRWIGEVPLGGFFCNGEIGPVQGTVFLHGYTSSFGLFRPRG